MNRIREFREKSKLTQLELSVEIGVERSTVAKWESGKTFPSADKLPKISRLLNCKIDDLFFFEAGESPAPPPPAPDPALEARHARMRELMAESLAKQR